jgi:PD-(D/E)XK nuclease superfamily
MDGWLSPTSTWRLLRCPASALPNQNPRSLGAIHKSNAGTLAHTALKTWIESGDWLNRATSSALTHHFDAALATAGETVSGLPNARMTRARLNLREESLRKALGGSRPPDKAHIHCEQELRDDEQRLRGVPDVAIFGPSDTAVIDLKTGHDAAAEMPEQVKLQLLLYAHLFRVTYGEGPQRLEVFSLAHGRIPVEATRAAIATAIERVETARSLPPLPQPREEVCRFCPRRLDCEAHWDALLGWERPDAIRGRVARVTPAESGVTAVLLDTDDGHAWVTQIPGGSLSVHSVGERIGFARVSRSSDREPQSWRFGPTSAYERVP